MNNFDPTTIEDSVCEVLRDANISKNVYHNRPRSTTTDVADFIVCKITGDINDRFAFGQFTLSVHLFARNVSNMKNGKKLSVMQGKVLEAMPRYLDDSLLIGGTPRILGDTDDGNGYHARIINYKVTIKATQ